MLYHDNPSLVFVTESWLDSSVTDGMIDPQGLYCVYRHDRPFRVGGGVLALVSRCFQSYQIAIPDQFCRTEVECFEIISDLGSFRFIVVYRPPDFNACGRDYMKQLSGCLRFLCDTDKIITIVGDTNLPHIDWSFRTASDDDIHSLFLKLCDDFGFMQFVSEPTRGEKILDLVLSNDPHIVCNLQVSAPFSNSDHSMVYFNLILSSHEVSTDIKRIYDFEHCDTNAISQALYAHPFNNTQPVGSADEVWDQFMVPITEIINAYVPVKVIRPRGKVTHVKKYPTHIRRAMKKKAKLWRKYRVDKSLLNKANYTEQAALCKKLVFEYEKSKELLVVNKSNIGSFYRYVNKRLSCTSGVGPLRSTNGSLVTKDSDKANMLNTFFGTVFTADDGKVPNFDRRVPFDIFLDTVEVCSPTVLKHIHKCKSGTSAGPDGIPQSFIKEFKFPLLNPLTVLYKHILGLGQVPSVWKFAHITPVFKKGISSDVSNYRPISLTSVFCKLLERVVQEKMFDYLLANGLISPHQHGFLAKHSTCTQLLETVNDWSLALRNRHVIDVVYFDFCKAFDSVSHTKLAQKLVAYGFSGKLLAFIVDFLCERSQQVVLPNGSSSSVPVLSGVPQGSVLGPVLFLLYVNDVADLFNSRVTIKLFADDIKIYMVIDNNSDITELQAGIDRVVQWSECWQLNLAICKCQYMRVGLKKVLDPVTYFVADSPLCSTELCVDLGVKIDSSLSFNTHINSIVAKAKLRANHIIRCFLSKDCYILTKAFTTYVRPLLEYCSPVWSPCYITLINKLESVQRIFTKRLNGLSSLAYNNRLTVLGLERLEMRRLKADLLTCFKIVHNYVDVDRKLFFEFAASNSITRGHSLKLVHPIARINARAHSFPVRVVAAWNMLPDIVVTAVNVRVFKSRLDSVDLSYAMVGKP